MKPEELYDTEIAPRLLEIAKLCGKHKLPFVAAVEYAPYSIGRTASYGPEAGVAIKAVDWAAQSHGNADKLIGALVRYCEKHGHQSMYLRLLGVKEGDPAGTPPAFAAFTVQQ